MANRFLDNNFYKSPFVRGLEGPLKSLYSFIICECSAFGVWPIDMEAASMYIGFQVNRAQFDQFFLQKGKAIDIGNSKFFFPDFIEHQYPSGLQSWNKAHNKIIIELNKFGFLREVKDTKLIPDKFKDTGILYFVIKGASKGLESPQGNGIGNGSGNGEGKGDGNTGIIDENYLIPKMFTVFQTNLPKYPAFVKKDFQPLRTIADFIHIQTGLNGNILNNQKVILEEWQKLCAVIAADNFYKTKTLSTISNSIQEIYQITKHGNAKQQSAGPTSTGEYRSGVKDEFNKRYGGRG